MQEISESLSRFNETLEYSIRVRGHLGTDWSAWLSGFSVHRTDHGVTLITGTMDQAALYGLLKKLRDSGLMLLSINPSDTGEN
jgi:hypothetical protein